MKVATLVFALLAIAAGCSEHRKLSAADWNAAHEKCKDHGGAQNLLRRDEDDTEFTAVCDDGRSFLVKERAPRARASQRAPGSASQRR